MTRLSEMLSTLSFRSPSSPQLQSCHSRLDLPLPLHMAAQQGVLPKSCTSPPEHSKYQQYSEVQAALDHHSVAGHRFKKHTLVKTWIFVADNQNQGLYYRKNWFQFPLHTVPIVLCNAVYLLGQEHLVIASIKQLMQSWSHVKRFKSKGGKSWYMILVQAQAGKPLMLQLFLLSYFRHPWKYISECITWN